MYMEKIVDTFGKIVKRELKQMGKQQNALADYLCVKKSTVSEWLNDHNEPSMRTIAKIALFLDVSTDYLLGLEDEAGNRITDI